MVTHVGRKKITDREQIGRLGGVGEYGFPLVGHFDLEVFSKPILVIGSRDFFGDATRFAATVQLADSIVSPKNKRFTEDFHEALTT